MCVRRMCYITINYCVFESAVVIEEDFVNDALFDAQSVFCLQQHQELYMTFFPDLQTNLFDLNSKNSGKGRRVSNIDRHTRQAQV